MQFTSLVTVASLSAFASAAAYANGTVVTVDVTVTGYTTYCPEPTTLTITVCDQDICKASEIEVNEPKTITVTEECVIPTSYTTNEITITKTVCDECEKTAAPEEEEAPAKAAPAESEAPSSVAVAPLEIDTTSTVYQNVTSYEGAGAKNAAGVAAGLVAIAAALL
ncbi:hypothetical protein KGF57_003780 [Candida theae]|uniref:Uncharacterized protein n=1 Tax=Candida theae TaxID=1198502 RepID=A0AAD5BC97_9ASCO|nr:uncharacterized protein KGF57_003780 [Candida theae]KAI5954757.1 hypothetical protein KGF57_003780 [Candida theae]